MTTDTLLSKDCTELWLCATRQVEHWTTYGHNESQARAQLADTLAQLVRLLDRGETLPEAHD